MPLPDLRTRRLEPELMDDPELDPAAHAHALRALSRINRASRTVQRIWSTLPTGDPQRGGTPVRVLDVGCGGGDVAVALARRAAATGVELEVHGCDISARALAFARDRARDAGVRLHLHRLDVLRDPLPGPFDLVTATLFLHHLREDDAVALLRRMAAAAPRILVQDLRRTRLGYRLAWWGVRLLSRSRVARVDGPRSVQAAFTLAEAASLARSAGLRGSRLEPVWPQRFCLTWSRT